MASWFLVDLPKHVVDDKRGFLVVAELQEVTQGLFPAAPRVYFVCNDDSEQEAERGCHLHPEKKELIVCARGLVTVELHSFGQCGEIALPALTKGLVINVGTWHRLTLSPKAVMVGIASLPFNSRESITDRLCNCHCLRE